MEKICRILLIAVLLFAASGKSFAQLGDPVLAATWKIAGQSESAAIAGATAATAATIPGIKWFEGETRDYINYRTKYYNYLDSIQGTLLIYANLVGLGLEVNDLIRSCRMVAFEVWKKPDNFLATTFASQKRQVILEVIALVDELASMLGVRIGKLIGKSQVKETKRYKMIEEIRLKMRALSTKIRVLASHIHYTNFYQLWHEIITEYEFQRCNKKSIVEQCSQRWILKGKTGIDF